MVTFFSQVKRPLFAAALILALGAGAAYAYDCNPCSRPVSVCAATPCPGPSPCVSSPCATTSPVSTSYVTTSGGTVIPVYPTSARTTYSGGLLAPSGSVYVSSDYSSTIPATPAGVTYLIPTPTGMVESRVPVSPMELESDVGRYYRTHVVQNGQVVQVSPR